MKEKIELVHYGSENLLINVGRKERKIRFLNNPNLMKEYINYSILEFSFCVPESCTERFNKNVNTFYEIQ
jgi:hypothetical protein